jgi:hypothetical protein
VPLRALVNGVDVIAPTLSDAESDALRDSGATVILPCCGSEGFLRRSPLGTLHFAHKRGAHCDAQGETIHHLKAKADIIAACSRAGYAATPEVAGDDWRADVLATRGAARIAFEVQWSFLRLDAARFRQERYARDGVRGCWFFRNPPPQLMRGGEVKALAELPLFHLFSNADHTFSVALHGRLYPLESIVEALLGGRIRFCKAARADRDQCLRMTPFSIDCPACGRAARVFHVEPRLTARCGQGFRLRETPLEFALRPDVLAAGLPLAGGAQVSAAGFRCPHCGALLDSAAVEIALYGTNRLAAAESIEFDARLRKPITGSAPHWCFPEDGVFCCEKQNP